MSPRALRPAELTPDARIARAKRLIAEAVGELVAAHVAQGVAAAEWVDQAASPLGKRRHLDLVRAGTLRGVKQGHQVLVRRKDINAYLDAQGVAPAVDDEDDVDGMMKAIAGGRR